jgi:hypothetical protein
MSSLGYQQQRAVLLDRVPQLALFLPPEAPPLPEIKRLTPREVAGHLRQTADNHAALVLVMGWGDGSVPRALMEDPLTRQKQINILVFHGEEAALAHSLAGDTPHRLNISGRVRLLPVRDRPSVRQALHEAFNRHEDLPQIGGLDVIAEHPLTHVAMELRAQLANDVYTQLSDRPQAYGNDIPDSVTGLFNSSANAAILLPAPTIGDMQGFFGDTPVISIAAGPSLKRHLPLLRELQHRCILVACDAVFHGLLDAGIDPHFVTPLERVDSIIPMLTRAKDSRSIYAGLPVCPPSVIADFGPERAIGLYCGDRLYNWLHPEPGARINTGLSTGTLSVTVASALGTGGVWLVGHDLSRDQQGTHWEGAAYAGNDWKRGYESVNQDKPFGSGYEDRMIRGNDGGWVKSIAWWDRFRDDISLEVATLREAGRTVYNVNAHDRICALIDHTVAAPLPDPASLPLLPTWKLPPRDNRRLDDWRARVRQLPADGVAFTAHFTRLRDDLAAARRAPPASWDLEAFARRIDLASGVSAGNQMAFSYFLRSALHNCNAEMHLRRRTASAGRSGWNTLSSMGSLCDALLLAMTKIQTVLEEIAHAHG